jgi:hypothetical protein
MLKPPWHFVVLFFAIYLGRCMGASQRPKQRECAQVMRRYSEARMSAGNENARRWPACRLEADGCTAFRKGAPIAVSMTYFLMAVSDGMSFVLDEVPPHPPRLGTGVVPCIETKCVSPLGPAGFLSATRCIDDKTSQPYPQGNPAPVQIPSQSSRIRVHVWCRMECRN